MNTNKHENGFGNPIALEIENLNLISNNIKEFCFPFNILFVNVFKHCFTIAFTFVFIFYKYQRSPVVELPRFPIFVGIFGTLRMKANLLLNRLLTGRHHNVRIDCKRVFYIYIFYTFCLKLIVLLMRKVDYYKRFRILRIKPKLQAKF